MDVTSENVGATLLELRSDKKLSRKALLEQLGGKPWTTGRLGDLEKGKHPWSYFRPREREMLLAWLEQQGVGVATLSADSVTPTERSKQAVEMYDQNVVQYLRADLIYGPDDSPVLDTVYEDDEPHLLEMVELVVAPTVDHHLQQSTTVGATSPYNTQYHEVLAAYEAVQVRLAGKPSVFPWPTKYRLDAAPPDDLERVRKWCERNQQWLDDVESGRAPFQDAAGTGTATTLPQSTVTSGKLLPASWPPDVAVTQAPVTPTEENPSSAPHVPPSEAVGATALSSSEGLRRLTNSELQTFKHCRRRWWLSWYRGLRLRDEPRTGVRSLGTWVHDALSKWYVPEGETPEDPRHAFNELVREEELALLQATSHLSDTDVATKVADFQKDADLGRAMLEGYVEWLAETGADVGLTVVAPEQVIKTVLECSKSLTVQVQGRLDVRLRRDTDLVQLFMDHKTVGNFTDPARRLPMDEQMKTYLLLEESQANGAGQVDGALYNMLRRVKRTAQAKPPFYERLEVRHNPTTVATFRERLKGEALTIDLVERGLDDGVDHHLLAYPTPSDKCSWGCEFFALCPMFDDGSRAEDFIQEHYVTVNPLDRYDHEGTES